MGNAPRECRRASPSSIILVTDSITLISLASRVATQPVAPELLLNDHSVGAPLERFFPLRLLVTAVQGDFGQGFVKALRLSRSPAEVHGCDASANGVGANFVDSFAVVPPASSGQSYVDRLDRLCATLRIDAVVPGSPPEIDALCRLSSPPALPSGVPVVCLDSRYRDVFDDKLLCYRALE